MASSRLSRVTVSGACDYRTLVSASSYFVARMAGVLAANLIAVGVALALANQAALWVQSWVYFFTVTVDEFLGIPAPYLLVA